MRKQLNMEFVLLFVCITPFALELWHDSLFPHSAWIKHNNLVIKRRQRIAAQWWKHLRSGWMPKLRSGSWWLLESIHQSRHSNVQANKIETGMRLDTHCRHEGNLMDFSARPSSSSTIFFLNVTFNTLKWRQVIYAEITSRSIVS